MLMMGMEANCFASIARVFDIPNRAKLPTSRSA